MVVTSCVRITRWCSVAHASNFWSSQPRSRRHPGRGSDRDLGNGAIAHERCRYRDTRPRAISLRCPACEQTTTKTLRRPLRMGGQHRLFVPFASLEVLSEFGRVLEVISHNLINVWQFQAVVHLNDLLSGCSAVEGTNDEIERHTRAAHAKYSVSIFSQRNFVNDGIHNSILAQAMDPSNATDSQGG